MKDSEKSKEQLINELQETRARIDILLKKDTERQISGLEQSGERYYKAFLASPDMLFISSVPDGTYIDVNDAYARNTGYSREELIGRTLEEFNFFTGPAEKEKLTNLLQKQGSFKGEERTFRVRSGQIQQWLCSAETVEIGGKKCMIAVAVDITERKKIEQSLNEKEQIIAMAFRHSPQAIGITTLKDARFIDVNDSHERLTGYTRDELIGHTAVEFNMWENMEARERIFRKLMTSGRVANEELMFRTKSGVMRPTLFSAEILKIRGEMCIIASSIDLTEQKKIAEALRESEEKFSRVFNSSPTSICLFNIEDSKFIDVNDSFTKFTGYSRGEILGRSPDELNLWVNPDEEEPLGKLMRETGGASNVRIHSRMKSGRIRTGLFSAQTIEIGGIKRLLTTIADITEQEEAQEAVAKESTLRRILIQNSRDGIVILDENGKVFEANRKYCEMLGYTPEEITKLHVWDWDTQWDRQNLMDQIHNVDEAGDHFETTHRRKDGSKIEVEISTNGAVYAGHKLVFCVCRDITHRKHMEKALRESEEKFSKAFHASPAITAITTVKDGTYIDINENYTHYTGFTREELIGHTARSLNIWAKPGQRADMLKTMDEHGRVAMKEYQFRIKTGEIRTWIFSAEKVMISGEPCLLGVSIDITGQKQIEAQAREAENLREVDRLRRELLANVSHELRTPLAGIKGFTSMLIDYGKRLKPDEKREYLETIDKNADRLSELIEQLLEMSRLEAGLISIKKKPADITVLCQSIIEHARKQIKGYVFKLELGRKLPEIEIDEKRIRQVLEHLLDNARKYSEPGTTIILSVHKREEDMLFTIADRGSGIPKEDVPHVFEHLFASKKRGKAGISGAGLGLSICKGWIEAHNGKIWIESEEGAGTKCYFTLPLKPVNPTRTKKASSSSGKTGKKSV